MITVIIKTELEQFKEQYPVLYKQVYDLGYKDGQNHRNDQEEAYRQMIEEDNDPSIYEPHPKQKRQDDSERFCVVGDWNKIFSMATSLSDAGYTSGNRNWKVFMQSYADYGYNMLIAYNPTHKLFVVESDYGVIEEIYPHLVDAKLVEN